ncbi:hypothetical protein EVAR_2451_1 [Eumeta japonica]|uniref:Uncharacterized protein n=1 Tax=Eumeta variegata TaxID=151549 RepID=A0A4C1SNK2_EUMVA|nr:hypothetical protein EVAR_2451_1 [Eumeta japonica]
MEYESDIEQLKFSTQFGGPVRPTARSNCRGDRQLKLTSICSSSRVKPPTLAQCGSLSAMRRQPGPTASLSSEAKKKQSCLREHWGRHRHRHWKEDEEGQNRNRDRDRDQNLIAEFQLKHSEAARNN